MSRKYNMNKGACFNRRIFVNSKNVAKITKHAQGCPYDFVMDLYGNHMRTE